MPYTPVTVVSYGFPQTADPFTYTYLLSGTFADDAAAYAAVGKAVTLDTAAANTFKLAGDGDVVMGRTFQVERRIADSITTASIQRKFKEKLPANSGHGIVVGNRVVGAGAGLVKKDTAGSGAGLVTNPLVVEVGTDYVVVEAL